MPAESPSRIPSAAAPQILPCNFRSAGRLSNDSIRHLRTMHDTFARNLSHSLDLFLGAPLEIKLLNVEQVGSREFVSSLAAGCYLVPFSLMPLQARVIAKFDNAVLFPLLDLLLGGVGEPEELTRELTDIDEELIRSVTELIGMQLERTWKACEVAVVPSPSIKPAVAGQFFLNEERIVVLNFDIMLGQTQAGMRIVLPMVFCNALVRSSHPEGAGTLGAHTGSMLPLRERVLDCVMPVSAELCGLSISVGELIAMEPGSVLNLHTSVDFPVRLNTGTYPLFDVVPVRRGTRKAAQLGAACKTESGADPWKV